MKNFTIKTTLLLFALTFFMSPLVFGHTFSGTGSGTAESPYQVTSAAQLDEVRHNLTAYYIQKNNIDLINYNDNNWVPIAGGATDDLFTGQYDGGGKIISNLTIDRTTNPNVGLFGHLGEGSITQPAVIRDVGLVNVNVKGARGTGSLVGRVTGNIYTLIENCSASGEAGKRSVQGDAAVGGLVGSNNSVTETPGGTNNPIISKCWANIDVTYSGVQAAGTQQAEKFGGLAGCNQKGTILDSYARGAVTVNNTENSWLVYNIGGLAGCIIFRGNVQRSYSTGEVSITGDISKIGGLVGNNTAGGGGNNGTASNAYWDINTSGQSTSAVGTGYSTAQMKVQANFIGFDFTNVWKIDTENDDYPSLLIVPVTTYITWNGSSSDVWGTASNWNLSRAPISTDIAVIPALSRTNPNYPVITTAITDLPKGMTVDEGANIRIDPGGQLTISDLLLNSAGPGGIIIGSSSAGTGSLLHNSTGVAGTIQRYIPAAGYHQVSVPLTAASNPTSILFKWSYLYEYKASKQIWSSLGTPTGTPLDVTRGYLIYKYPGPKKWSADTTYSLAGTMNNGNFSATVIYNETSTFNLVPNPYPSAIDWDAASGWTGTNIGGSYWMWIHSAENYGVWDGSTGTHHVTKDIPVGQAFFVEATAASPVLSFNNSVRLHSSQAFYKSGGEEALAALRVAAASAGGRDESVLMFCDTKADAVYDPMLDARKMFGGATSPQLYWLSGDQQQLSIFRHPHPTNNISIALGFEMGAAGQVAMRFEGAGKLAQEGTVWLEDLKTGQMTDLLQEDSYSFEHETGDDPARFVLHVATEIPSGGIGTQELPFHRLYASGRQIHASVPSLAGQPAEAEVFDMLGRSVQKQDIMLTAGTAALPPVLPGAYVVRLVTGNQVFTGRVVVK